MKAPRITAPAAGGALCVLLTATACTSGTTADPAPGPRKLTLTTPAATGALDDVTWNLPMGEPRTLDSAKVADYSPSTVKANLCDSLLRLEPDYSIAPGLASSWSRPDDKTLVLNLRKGVRFWNGHPMTAGDVVSSLRRQGDPATQSVNASLLARVKTITATGAHQVTVRFESPDEMFFKGLATSFGTVNEAAYVKKAGRAYGSAKGGLMCTGPFELASWKPGESITATRNAEYWDTSLRPKIKKLRFTFITDGSTLTSALLSGEVDGSYEISSAGARALGSADVGTLYHGPSAQTNFIAAIGEDSPLADRKISEALSLVLDRDDLIKNVYAGAAQKLKTFVPPLVWENGEAADIYAEGYDALPAVPGVDVEKAEKLVDQARTERRTLTVAMAAGDQQSQQTLTFLQAGAKRIGIKIVIKQLQPTQMSGLFFDASLRKGLDATMVLGYVEIPDPISYAQLLTDPESLFNWTKYRDPEVTSLLDRARAATEPTKSARLFTRAQQRYSADLPVVPLASPHERLFLNKRLSGAPSSFAYLNMPWAAHLGGTGKGTS
ncbi:diguanylate phosphodiesterase [Streptomyces longisporoflavus]|uniref:ABC transporter substrate-binding protein n=1 Tax=Streptomyces longisporoflavus TaxID=28044 RepID=UPI00167C4661|nr:ABC transporter substrate-binding protein [Streptomyces longisporoflavus]GGV40232.1 diguanylate phosphodiesterase [Streptomyces longisporoflavus]